MSHRILEALSAPPGLHSVSGFGLPGHLMSCQSGLGVPADQPCSSMRMVEQGRRQDCHAPRPGIARLAPLPKVVRASSMAVEPSKLCAGLHKLATDTQVTIVLCRTKVTMM